MRVEVERLKVEGRLQRVNGGGSRVLGQGYEDRWSIVEGYTSKIEGRVFRVDGGGLGSRVEGSGSRVKGRVWRV